MWAGRWGWGAFSSRAPSGGKGDPESSAAEEQGTTVKLGSVGKPRAGGSWFQGLGAGSVAQGD